MSSGESGRPPTERETAEFARDFTDRAVKRLNILEHLFLLVAAGAALLAGLLVAWLLNQSFELPFRSTWAAASLVLFLLPAGLSWLRVRREDREELERRRNRLNSQSENTSTHE